MDLEKVDKILIISMSYDDLTVYNKTIKEVILKLAENKDIEEEMIFLRNLSNEFDKILTNSMGF